MKPVELTVQVINLRLQGYARIVRERNHFTLVLTVLGQCFDDQAHCTQRHPFTGQALQYAGESKEKHDALQLLHQFRLGLLEPGENGFALLDT